MIFFEEEKRGTAGEKNKREKSHCFLKAWSWEGEEGHAATRADRTATQRMGWSVNYKPNYKWPYVKEFRFATSNIHGLKTCGKGQ